MNESKRIKDISVIMLPSNLMNLSNVTNGPII